MLLLGILFLQSILCFNLFANRDEQWYNRCNIKNEDVKMIEIIVLIIFAAALFACIGLNVSILFALLFGVFLFSAYGLYKKHTVKELLLWAFSGIGTVKNILVTFILIGMLTAIWRAAGTIPFIVYYSTKICSPHAMVLITFLLCCLISSLTGTAFGTAATMGVICVTIANNMGIPIIYTGGAVLAGSYFGDRCSPMSTSALLVSSLTKTDLFRNIAKMIKTSWVPFLITCGVYTFVGLGLDATQDTAAVQAVFKHHFVLHPLVLIPAVVIVLFSLFRVDVKITMSISIICGAVISMWVQKIAPGELLQIALFGYHPSNEEVYALLSGGGILSMKNVFLIVCLSSCYIGIFKGTGFLDGIHERLLRISRKITPYGCILLTSIITAMISCNQTLSVVLTHQLCEGVEKDRDRIAIHLENTAVVVAPLIPWSIACAVPLASVDAPMWCILTACYLYLLPIWNALKNRKRECP